MTRYASDSFDISIAAIPSWWPSVGSWVNAESAVPALGKPSAAMNPPLPSNPGPGSANGPDQPYSQWNSASEHGGYIYFYNCGGHNARYWNGLIRVGPWNTAAGPRWQELKARTPDGDLVYCAQQYSDGRPTSVHTWNKHCIVHGLGGYPDSVINNGASGWCNVGGGANDRIWSIGLNGADEQLPFVRTAPSPFGEATASSSLVFDPNNGHVIFLHRNSFAFWDPVTDAFNSQGGYGGFTWSSYVKTAPVPSLDLIGALSEGDNPNFNAQFVAMSLSDPADQKKVFSVDSLTGTAGSIAYVSGIGNNGAFILTNGRTNTLSKIEIPDGYNTPSVAGSAAVWPNPVSLGMTGPLPIGPQAVQGGLFGQFCSPAPGLLVMPVTSASTTPWTSANHFLYCARIY